MTTFQVRGEQVLFFLFFFTILCHVDFTILSVHYRQTNFPIIKTKPFKVTKYKKEWWIIRPKWAKIKNRCYCSYFLIANKIKMHIIYQKKVIYFPGGCCTLVMVEERPPPPI